MVFDPTEPEIDEIQFSREDLSATPYGSCTGDILPNAPEPRGVRFMLVMWQPDDPVHVISTWIKM